MKSLDGAYLLFSNCVFIFNTGNLHGLFNGNCRVSHWNGHDISKIAKIERLVERGKMKISKNAIIFTALLLCNAAALVYPQTLLTLQPAEKEGLKDTVLKMSQNATLRLIFGNNIVISALGMVPILGIPFTWQVLYNTGMALAAVDASILYVALNPIVWMEMSAYTISAYYSIKLLYYLEKKRLHRALYEARTGLFTVFCLLFIAAVLEVLILGGGV